MKYLVQLSFCLSLLLLMQCKNEVPPEVNKSIAKIKQTYAPDKRVACFSVDPHYENGKLLLSGASNIQEAVDALVTDLSHQGIKFENQINILPDKALGSNHYGVVRLSVANIRSDAKHSGELATQAMMGTPLKVYKQEDNWYWVQTPDGYISWLDEGGFQLMNEHDFQRWMAASKGVYLPDFGFAYQEADVNSPITTDLLAGNIFKLNNKEEDFTEVEFPDGRTAFVPSNEIMEFQSWVTSRDPNVSTIIQTAKRFMGRPYLWGGTSGKGVDCSGFTKTVFFLNGIQLPRDASQQVHVGKEVETDTTLVNLAAGDLLFFGRKATAEKKEKITHVALYLGNGQIIHSAGIVKIESLRRRDVNFAEDRLKTFVRAKRPFNSIGKNGITKLMDVPFYSIANH
ncbi:MAG: C40 family peptidase [Saprospiraceae bacterium]|nr:C40 family peptidase [Saprospiraceae bacterium]